MAELNNSQELPFAIDIPASTLSPDEQAALILLGKILASKGPERVAQLLKQWTEKNGRTY